MPRYFVPVTIEELKQKIDKYSWNDLYELIEKDLKVEFSTENILNKQDELVGYHTEENGFTYLGIVAGGDWEVPVFFCLYWDGKKIRAYIPTEGNTWNTKTKMAYGNDEEEDSKNIKKRFPNFDIDEIYDLDFDISLIKKDIFNRITSK